MIYIKKFSKGDIFTLFLIVSFPIHLWSIFLIFQDFQWVMERTVSLWDAVGYASYSLAIALVESILISLLLFLSGFLLPKQWNIKQILSVLGILIFVISFWAIINQLYFFYGPTWSSKFQDLFIASEHPVRWYYVFVTSIIGLVLTLVAAPIFFTSRGQKLSKITGEIFDRIIILSAIYIFLDFIGIIIVIVRNL